MRHWSRTRRSVIAMIFAAGAVGIVAGAFWFLPIVDATVTCSLPSDPAPCEHTGSQINDWVIRPLMFDVDPGKLRAVDIRPAPAEWAERSDGYGTAARAAYLEPWFGPPILAACYYQSDDLVACDTNPTPSGG